MTKRECIEGGVILLGILFLAEGAVYLVQMLLCWIYVKMTAVSASQATFSAGYAYQIVGSAVKLVCGAGFIWKSRALAQRVEVMGIRRDAGDGR